MLFNYLSAVFGLALCFVFNTTHCFLVLFSVLVYLLGYHYDSFVLGHVTF